MYPFLTLDDETEIVHSERLEDICGFSDAEIDRYLEVIRSTAHLIKM